MTIILKMMWIGYTLHFTGLSLLESEGKVFDCLVRPPTLKHVATIGDQDGDEDDEILFQPRGSPT